MNWKCLSLSQHFAIQLFSSDSVTRGRSTNGARLAPERRIQVLFLGMSNYMPWRAIDNYYHYLLMRPEIPRIATDLHWGRDLVVVRGDSHPDYSSAWTYNPLRWDAEAPIYVSLQQHSNLRNDLIKAFPGRHIWILDGPTVTKAGYRISGPLSADQFLRMDLSPK